MQLESVSRGFKISWGSADAQSAATYRIEVSGSVDPRWTTLAVLPQRLTSFWHATEIDAEWVCLRIRAEVGRAVSLWATAGDPNDRQFCFKPSSPVAGNP